MKAPRLLASKTAIVTGGGTGIGRAIALAFGAAGADVVICGRRKAPCDAVVAELEQGGARALAVSCDVGVPLDVAQLMEAALAHFGRIDILVNNAAIAGASRPFAELSIEQWERTLTGNLTSVFLCSQAATRHMVKSGGGKIINIASMLATKVVYNSADYCASKGGVLQLTRAMALELARDNVQVNAISPGYFHTEFAPDLPETEEEAKIWAKKKRVPAGRLGDPAELAPLAVLLASDAGNYTLGSTFVVDGGVLLA